MNENLKNQKDTMGASCECQRNDGLFIPTRQASAFIALACLFMLALFFGGYFLGKQHMVEHFVARVEQDAFADQIYSSLCALYDQEPDNDEDDAGGDSAVAAVTEERSDVQDVAVAEQDEVSNGTFDEFKTMSAPVVQETKKYYAQLVGFSTKSAAQQLVKKLANKKITVVIQSRESNTAKGKKTQWYQVVTEAFDDRVQLAKIVDRITKEENIKGAQIRVC